MAEPKPRHRCMWYCGSSRREGTMAHAVSKGRDSAQLQNRLDFSRSVSIRALLVRRPHGDNRRQTMKFLVLVKPTKDSEAGVHPEEKVIMETMRFNEEMVKAGVLLDAGGLWPSSQGKRIRVEGTTRQIIDGPFTETKELIGGYWMVQAKSFDEAVAWMKRCPTLNEDGSEIGIRRLVDVGDFPEMGEEVNEMHKRLEEQVRR